MSLSSTHQYVGCLSSCGNGSWRTPGAARGEVLAWPGFVCRDQAKSWVTVKAGYSAIDQDDDASCIWVTTNVRTVALIIRHRILEMRSAGLASLTAGNLVERGKDAWASVGFVRDERMRIGDPAPVSYERISALSYFNGMISRTLPRVRHVHEACKDIHSSLNL